LHANRPDSSNQKTIETSTPERLFRLADSIRSENASVRGDAL